MKLIQSTLAWVLGALAITISPITAIAQELHNVSYDLNVDAKGTRDAAEAYLKWLYSEEAQELIGKHFYRPRSGAALAKYGEQFPKIELVTIDGAFGGCANAQKTHFADGGIFDQIYHK